MSGISPENYSFSTNIPELPAGRYMVIDPCYIIGEDPFWSDFVKFSFPEDKGGRGHEVVVVHVDNLDIIIFSTAFGDGLYPVSQDGIIKGKAGVDAGCLCLVPMEFIDNHNLDANLGVEVYVDEDSTPLYNEGNWRVSRIFVETNEEEEEAGYYTDEDDDYYDEEDEEE